MRGRGPAHGTMGEMRRISARGSRAPQRAWTSWAIVGAIATLAAGCSSAGAGPTTGPSASAATSSAPSPAPSVSTTGVALPGQVTVDPSLPDAKPLPPGIWAQTTPGWVLATYEPTVVTWDEASGAQAAARTRQVVYLVSPDGTRYQALELDANHPLAITSWTAGQSVAYVEDCGGNAYCTIDTGPTYTLDLATGDLSLAQVPAGADHIATTLAGSTRLWLETTKAYDAPNVQVFLDRNGTFTTLGKGWDRPQVSPDAAWIAMDRWDPQPNGTSIESTGVINVAAGTLATVPAGNPALPCSFYEWSEDSRIVEYCYATDGTESWVAVDPATLVTTSIGSPLPAPGALAVSHDVLVAPGVWAGLYGTGGFLMWQDPDGTVGISNHGAPSKVTLLDADGTPIRVAYPVAAVAGVVYFTGKQVAVDEAGPATIVAYDVATKKQSVLLPTPPGGPAAGGGLAANQEAIGVTSWVVAP